MDKYIGKTLKGKEFIDLFPEISEKLAKLTNFKENHNGYKFGTGLNIDKKKFDADKKCGNGIYFTDIDNMIRWMSYRRTKVIINFFNIYSLIDEHIDTMVFYRKVTLPLDCNICIESRDKFKADKIILGDRIRIIDLDLWKDEKICLEFIEKQNTEIAMIYIRNYSDKVKLALVKKNPLILNDLIHKKHLKISEEIQLEAVKRNGLVIRYINKPSEEVQLEAVKQNINAIHYIKNPNEKVQIYVVKTDGSLIEYIKNPTKEVQIITVRQDGAFINSISDPSKDIQLEAVKQHPESIKYIESPSEKVRLAALNQNKN